MGLRELKETAHAQYVRGRFGQCAETYQQILKLAPKDPNMRVRHAEACRRAGERQQAIVSYRMAADLLLAVGCESRARGAIKAALELDPKDPVLLAELARLGPSGTSASGGLEEECASASGLPAALEWELSSAPARSLTSAGVPAPRSMTSAGVPAPRSVTSAGVPAPRSMTSAGVPAPRSMTSAGVPPPRSVTSAGVPAPRSMTSAGVPAPAPRPLASTGIPAIAPVRSVASSPQGASTASAPPRRATLALPAAPESTRPSPPVAGASAPRTTPPLPPATKDPAWAASGAFASAQGPGSAPRASTPVTPAPLAAPQAASSVTPPPAPSSDKNVRLQVEVRRLSPQAVAFRLSPQSRWVLFTSRAPISVSREDSLDSVPQQVRDFTLDITVEEPSLDEGSLH
jgi:hypothetical protein